MLKKYSNELNYVYHYTLKENVQKIIKDKKIIANNDKYTFFCSSLEESKLVFNNLMCKENKYINNNLEVQERVIQKPEDYVIFKIKCKNDNNFYTFNFKTSEEFNPYNYSIMHLGSLKFKEFEIFEIKETEKPQNILMPKIKKGAIAASIIGIMFMNGAGNTYATNSDTWLDNSSYYDISWYNEVLNDFLIDDAKEFAGLAHLVNDGNITFDGKTININGNLDLRAHNWETIDSKFMGVIEGIHKIILNSDAPQISNNATLNGNAIYEETLNTLEIENLDVQFNEYITLYSKEVANTVQMIKLKCSSDTGNITLKIGDITEALQNNVSKDINLNEGNNKLEIIVKDANNIEKKYELNIFRKQSVTITASNSLQTVNISPNGVIKVQKGDSKNFNITAVKGNKITSVKVNGVEKFQSTNQITQYLLELKNINEDITILVETQKIEEAKIDPPESNLPENKEPENKEQENKESESKSSENEKTSDVIIVEEKDETPKTGKVVAIENKVGIFAGIISVVSMGTFLIDRRKLKKH